MPAFVSDCRDENGVFADEIGNVEWKDREIDPPEAAVPLAPEERIFEDGFTDFPDFVLEATSESRFLALVIIDRRPNSASDSLRNSSFTWPSGYRSARKPLRLECRGNRLRHSV